MVNPIDIDGEREEEEEDFMLIIFKVQALVLPWFSRKVSDFV